MVNCRSTFCGIHWLGWASFATLIIGVAAQMIAIALPNWYAVSGFFTSGTVVYVGLWSLCEK